MADTPAPAAEAGPATPLLSGTGDAGETFRQATSMPDQAVPVAAREVLERYTSAGFRKLLDEVVAGRLADAGPAGILLAGHWLVGLAAAVRLFPDLQLVFAAPMLPHHRGEEWRAYGGGSNWQQLFGRLDPAGPPVMLLRLGDEFDRLRSMVEKEPALRDGRLLVLGASASFDDDDREVPLVVNLADDLALQADLLARSKLLSFLESHDVRTAAALVEQMGLSAADVWNALNTPGSREFTLRAWQNHWRRAKRHPSFLLFNRFVLGVEDGAGEAPEPLDGAHPRHAASLFLASHFAALPVGEFVRLSDLLTAATPSPSRPAAMVHAPNEVTDRVCAMCKISFRVPERTGDGDRRIRTAVLQDPDQPERDPADVAAALRLLFEELAPLLRERYLRALAMDMTFGHVLPELASDFRQLELASIAEGGADEEWVGQRLARTIFGYPAFERRHAGYLAENRQRFVTLLEAAMRRAPALVRDVHRVTRVPVERLVSQVADVTPVESEDQPFWIDAFAQRGAMLFWEMYADEGGVTLQAYPALFPRDAPGRPGETARIRRVRLIQRLRTLVLNGDGEAWDDRTGAMSRRLIGDTCLQAARFDTDADEHVASRLLTVALASALTGGLRGRLWRQSAEAAAARPATAEGVLEAVAAALCSEWFTRWLAGRGALRVTPDEDSLPAAAEDVWRLAAAAMEAMVGCSSMDDIETEVLQFWVSGDLDGARLDTILPWRRDRGADDLDDDPTVASWADAFLERVRVLKDVVPVAGLMILTAAGTAEGTVRFDLAPLRGWLVTRMRFDQARCNADRLLEATAKGRALQGDYARRLGALNASIDTAWRRRNQVFFQDRQGALTEFERTIRDECRIAAEQLQGVQR